MSHRWVVGWGWGGCRWNQSSTDTGRLSSNDPNVQSLPKEKDEHRIVRSLFRAAPGKRLISADYRQMEIRLLAVLSRDRKV